MVENGLGAHPFRGSEALVLKRSHIIIAVMAMACFGCSSADPAITTPAETGMATTTSETPAVTTSIEPTPEPAVQPVPPAQPITFECGDLSLYQSGTALYSDGTTGYEADCDTYVAPAPPEFSYCDYGGTSVNTDGSYTVNDPRCAAPAPPADSGYPYNESEDRNGDGVVNGYERCGELCGDEPTSGDIQTQYGCEQGYITGPQCDE
ncbi:MAG: hypothetical protein ACOH2Q_20440 [Rhodococcus sp. (in: high G+C Gram-positive bacteria)]